MLTRLRQKLSIIVSGIARSLAGTGISPNHITILSLIFTSLGFLVVYLYRNIYLYILFILLSGLCDVLDGAIARLTGRVSRFGAFLDSTIDRVNDFLIIYPLKYLGLDTDLVVLSIILSILISYTRARAESLGLKMEGVGIIERAERIIFVIVIALLISISMEVAYILLWILIIFSLITVIQRIHYSYRNLRET